MSDNTYSSGKDFSQDLIIANLMGPNVVSIFNELCAGKLPAGDDAQICDLGCGAGLSSLAIAAACEGRIHAIDSWNTPEQNRERFDRFTFGNRIVAVQADAPVLPYDEGYFDTLICLDSYNYFGRAEGVIDQVASYGKKGGKLFMGISGIKRDATEDDMKVFGFSWSEEQMDFIRTLEYWKGMFERSESVRVDSIYEMRCHESAWRDWLACDNEYAVGDRAACEAGAIDMMCTIGVELTRIA